MCTYVTLMMSPHATIESPILFKYQLILNYIVTMYCGTYMCNLAYMCVYVCVLHVTVYLINVRFTVNVPLSLVHVLDHCNA